MATLSAEKSKSCRELGSRASASYKNEANATLNQEDSPMANTKLSNLPKYWKKSIVRWEKLASANYQNERDRKIGAQEDGSPSEDQQFRHWDDGRILLQASNWIFA